MKLHYVALAVASLGTAAAQSISDLPSCATKCATDSLPKSCSQLDIGCVCADKSFISNISCCVAKACPKDKQDAALKFARQICTGAGVTDLPESASCDSGASETATATGSSSQATESSETTASGTVATSASGASSTGSSSSSAASESPTNAGAALGQKKEVVLAAAAGAAAFALLA